MIKVCFICGSFRFVDEHHYDCKEGEISPEKVPLCRRCHRTYHDWGIASFSPGTTEKAIEVENVRRQIYRLPPMTISDVQRSSYWCKKWGIAAKPKVKPKEKYANLQYPLPL